MMNGPNPICCTGGFSLVRNLADLGFLKGNSHQILLSEISPPGIEVLIEKLLAKILWRVGRKTPQEDAKLPSYSASAL